jgi:hypothetical protein
LGALQRTYTLRLPSADDGSTLLPLVIDMHGGFGSGTLLENQSQLSFTAEQDGSSWCIRMVCPATSTSAPGTPVAVADMP